MGAPAQMLLATGAGIVIDPQNGNMWADSTAGDFTAATIAFGSDGSIDWTATPVDAGSSVGDTQWYNTAIAGIGSSFWIRFTATSGTLTTNTASTFTSLSSAQSCSKSGVTATGTVTVTAEIATDSGGSNIVYTMSGIILRYQHTL